MEEKLSLEGATMYIDGKPIGEISNDRELFVTISEDGDLVDPKFCVSVPEMEITLSAKICEKLMDRLCSGPCKRWRLRRKVFNNMQKALNRILRGAHVIEE